METLELKKELTITQRELQKFGNTNEEIALLKAEFMALRINGVEDKVGYKKNYESRQIVKRILSKVEKDRVIIKKPVIELEKAIDARAKEITNELTPIYLHLEANEAIIDHLIAEKKAAEDKAESLRIQTRIDQLSEYGFAIDIEEVKTISDEIFALVLQKAKDDRIALNLKQQAANKLKELEDQKAEDARLEQVRLFNEKQEEQRLLDAKLKADREKLEKEKLDFENLKKAQQAPVAVESKLELIVMDPALRGTIAPSPSLGVQTTKSDFQLFTEFLAVLRTIKVPEVKSEPAIAIAAAFKKDYNTACITLKSKIEML